MTDDARTSGSAREISGDDAPKKKIKIKTTRKLETKKPPAKKASKKKAASKKTASKKAASKKATSKKATTKKAATKKATSKALSKKAASKKSATKKATSKKAPSKKAASKKSGPKKAATKKTSKKKAPEPAFVDEDIADTAPKPRRQSKKSRGDAPEPSSDESPIEDRAEPDRDDARREERPRREGRDDARDEDGEPRKKKRRRRRRRRRGGGEGEGEGGEGQRGTRDGARRDNDNRPRRRDRDGERGGHHRDRSGRRDSGRGHDRDRDRGQDRDRGGDDRPRTKSRPKRAGDRSDHEGVRERDPSIFDQNKTFHDLGLSDEVADAIAKDGYTQPTAIQAGMIPAALDGRDVLGQAKTGTGKTAAFSLPLVEMCDEGDPFQAVIVAPTRELAVQITEELNKLARGTELRAVTIYGGARMGGQIDQLAKGPEIIVGTPGRLLDMCGRGYLKLDRVRFAVLDEVDRMFDIGFRDDIGKILRLCPKERQTLVVSATISPEIEELARKYMRNAEKIETSAGSLTVALVEQHHIPVQPWDKRRLLTHLLTHEEPALTVVFCRLKRTVDSLAEKLTAKGIESFAIHGDLPQKKREKIVKQLKAGHLEVLIASDLAARGLDVDDITHVINYDLPDDPEVYVHRIGRTARIGRQGVAWSLVTPEQGKLLTEIEVLIGQEVPKLEYPDFKPRPKPDDWKDANPHGHVTIKDVPDATKQNRHALNLPAEVKEKPDAKRFPGGLVPTALPPKRMGGRSRTRKR